MHGKFPSQIFTWKIFESFLNFTCFFSKTTLPTLGKLFERAILYALNCQLFYISINHIPAGNIHGYATFSENRQSQEVTE